MDNTAKEELGTFPERGRERSMERTVFLLLPFVSAFLYGLWSYSSTGSYYADLDAFGIETQATIISKRVIGRGTDRPRPAYEVMVSFTANETMRRGKIRVTGDFYGKHNPPDQVPIRYLPDDPQIREIDPAMRNQSRRGAVTIIGVLLCVGVANLFMSGSLKRHKRRQIEVGDQ